tara:strand:- start:131 stop:370 length:240 start_codon:yes stop_codon:yes gene_type:complete
MAAVLLAHRWRLLALRLPRRWLGLLGLALRQVGLALLGQLYPQLHQPIRFCPACLLFQASRRHDHQPDARHPPGYPPFL